jgi:hypothetical protein
VKKAIVLIGALVALAAIGATAAFAYGPASPVGVSAGTLAKQMQSSDWGSEGKDKLSDVTCLRKTGRSYTCMGTYTPDEDSASAQEDTDAFGLTDPRPMTYEVVVNFDGNWIAKAE